MSATAQQPKNNTAYKIFAFIGLAIIVSAFNVLQKNQTQQQTTKAYVEKEQQQTNVWVPGTTGMLAYADVEILKKDSN